MLNSYELEENGFIYIVNEYENGVIEKYLKPDENINENIEQQLSQYDMQEQILLNTEYLVAVQELNTI